MQTNRRAFSGALLASGVGMPSLAQQAAGPQLDSARFRQAAISGDVAAVIRFLDSDPALLYSRDANGNSVYTLAWLAGKKDVVKTLEERGLKLDIFEAAVSGNVLIATEIVRAVQGVVHLRSIDGRTPLHYATAGAHPAMVMFLNGQGADLSAGPESPVFAAAECADPEIGETMAQTLLGNASDPNAKRKDGTTLLHAAAARGNAAVVRILVHRGADVGAKDSAGRTPLDVATGDAVPTLKREREIERVYFGARYKQSLRGERVQRDDTEGLPQNLINQFVTFAHSDPERVKAMLVKCPSLLLTRATFDELAIEAAAHMGIAALAAYLAERGSPVSACTAVMLGETEMVKAMLVDDRARVRERGAHDFPVLAYTAFAREQAGLAEMLLAAGADVHAKAFAQTILHLAAAKGYVDLGAVLLRHGADVNAATRTAAGPVTPLAVAIRQKQEKMVRFLRERGGRS